MAARTSAPDVSRTERSDRWDRDRFHFEQDRDRDGYSEVRERFERDDDHVYSRGPERRPRRYDDEDDLVVRERRRVVYDDEPRYERRRPSPPDSEFSRRVSIQRERERVRSPSPPRRRPGPPLRRQSSLDTFDRKPARRYERDFSPPVRGDYRAPPYVPIPLPRSKALPPPRVYAERDFYEEVHTSGSPRRMEDDFRPPPPERIHEREVVHTRRRRSRSRSSRATRTSRSSSTSSSSSDGGTTITSRSEYPKKGKTRIPARLVSKRALIDLGYPYVEEVSACDDPRHGLRLTAQQGNQVIVQRALGQQNIDNLLKLSDDYKKS